MKAQRWNARPLRLRLTQSLAKGRQRLGQAMVRSTIRRGRNHESAHVGPLDGLHVELPADPSQTIAEPRALTAAVGVQRWQEWEQPERRTHQQHAAIAMLDISRRTDLARGLLATLHTQGMMQAIQRAVIVPVAPIIVHRAARRQILR